jgi:hypothetical protein
MGLTSRFAAAFCIFALGVSSAYAQSPEHQVPSVMRVLPEPKGKLPTGVILVKGAVASASDHHTPLPEDGVMGSASYESAYFGLTYPLPENWVEQVKGPPPSDSGVYVLALLIPSEKLSASVKGSILVTAQDLFFNLAPATNALEMVRYTRDHLQPGVQVDRTVEEVRIGGRSFARLDYSSPIAGLHWSVLATQIRCHSIQFVFMGRSQKVIDTLIKELDRVKLPAEASVRSGRGGGEVPVCIADYASPENIVERTEPFLAGHRYNPVPVRIIIDKEGHVKHVHLISAFPDQSAAITEALLQWRFKPYVKDGQPMEVETGLMFGSPPRHPQRPAANDAAGSHPR